MKIIFLLVTITTSIFVFAKEPSPKPSSEKEEIFDEYLQEVVASLCSPPETTIEYLDSEKPNGMMIIFNKMPSKSPYKVEYKRLKQFNPNEYQSAREQQFILNTTRKDNETSPFGIFLPRRDYLPGERVFWRIVAQDGKSQKKACCSPRPLRIKNQNGELLADVILVSANRPKTVYLIWFPERKKEFQLMFRCGDAKSTIQLPAGPADCTTFEPKEKEKTGGIASISILQGEESLLLDVPWGSELEKF